MLGVRFLPPLPREPARRLRLLSLWFALFAVGIEIIELSVGRLAEPAARLGGGMAVIALGAWVIRGYRRGRFPEFSSILEAALLVVITAASSLPLRGMGLFLAMVQFRSLYVTRREFWVLPISYGVARVFGMMLTVQPAPYEALSVTVLFQFFGLAFISGILFLLMLSVERERIADAALAQSMTSKRRLEEQLHESQKMEAVGQLAGGVAHDFNNLLTVIGGHVYMLEQAGPLPPNTAKHIEGITRATERAGALTRQLLAFGRRQMLHPTNVDLNAIVRNAVRLIAPLLGERIRLSTELADDLPMVHADAGQLEQVLLNLALNARDAMPDGGRLRIATSVVETPEGPRVSLTMRDTGMGMDAATLPHVFEPFFTTKRVGKGSGLGLATAYGIVKQSSGDIQVESAGPGQGATFTILLPAAPAAAGQAVDQPAHSRRMAIPLGVSRALLVEDDDGVREFAREVLMRAGISVVSAKDGLEGLAKARADGFAFDIVVTDVVMPELSGPRMVERLREARPDLKVLYITGYADDAVTTASLRAGHELLLEKPFTARALRDAVSTLSRTQTPASLGAPPDASPMIAS